MKFKQIIITGASGQLANEIKLLSQDYKDFEFHFFTKDKLDITKRDQVNKVFSKIKAHYIINTAAYTKVDLAESNETDAFAINAYALQNISTEARDARVIHISTDYVYNSLKDIALTESAPTNPQSIYAKSKLLGERILAESHSHFIIIRTSWLYGPQGHNFVNTILNLSRTKDSLRIIDDQIGAPTYARDLASTILKFIEGTETFNIKKRHWNQIYNYSNRGKISWFTFAKEIVDLTGITMQIVPIKSYEYPTKAKRPVWSVLDLTKISQVPEIKIYDWKKSLAHCIDRIIN